MLSVDLVGTDTIHLEQQNGIFQLFTFGVGGPIRLFSIKTVRKRFLHRSYSS